MELSSTAESGYTLTDDAGVTIIRSRSPVQGTLVQAVQAVTGLTQEAAEDLIGIGAVYLGEDALGKRGPHKVSWRRAVSLFGASHACEAPVSVGQWVRVHPEPKRFPACEAADWQSCILLMDDDYIAISKPAGVLSMAHESNLVDAAPARVASALGTGELQPCHRLDVYTSGVLVMARGPGATQRLTMAFQDRKGLRKVYKALTAAPVPLGSLRHYMFTGPFRAPQAVMSDQPVPARGPRLLSAAPLPGWKACEVEVLDCKAAPEGARRWCEEAGLHDPCLAPDSGGGRPLYETTLLLKTGRTHQIRAQLAACGAPIIGDSMYRMMASVLVDEEGRLPPPAQESARLVCAASEERPASAAIGLHAWRLSWEAGGYEFEAPAPWWARAKL